MRKVEYVTETTIQDETGQVIEKLEQTIVKLPSEPPYMKFYFEEVHRLFDLKDSSEIVLIELAMNSNFEGLISIGKRAKEIIMQRRNMKKQTIDNALQDLNKKGLIKRVSRGEYEINPHIFAKGDWANIKNRRKYFDNGMEINVNIKINKNAKRTVKLKVV